MLGQRSPTFTAWRPGGVCVVGWRGKPAHCSCKSNCAHACAGQILNRPWLKTGPRPRSWGPLCQDVQNGQRGSICFSQDIRLGHHLVQCPNITYQPLLYFNILLCFFLNSLQGSFSAEKKMLSWQGERAAFGFLKVIPETLNFISPYVFVSVLLQRALNCRPSIMIFKNICWQNNK